ncbi:hypothetical protein F5887DRAFT_1083736 [Amanita rubescens]|nr:hypothetical protein F5887DRAFT_1083736 [Amanita rubescens]
MANRKGNAKSTTVTAQVDKPEATPISQSARKKMRNAPSDQQDEAPSGPRAAKVAALKNAVWKQGAPTGTHADTRKRAASPTMPVSKSKKPKSAKQVEVQQSTFPSLVNEPHARLTSVHASLNHLTQPPLAQHEDVSMTEDDSGAVSIPLRVPAAPKKPSKKQGSAATSQNRPKVSKDVFISDADESDDEEYSSVTETDSPLMTEAEDLAQSDEDGSEDGDDVGGKLTAAKKRFLEEQPSWSGDENKEPSAALHGKKFVIRGSPIVISSDDSDVIASTVELPEVKKEPLQPSGVLNASHATVRANIKKQRRVADSSWPEYTHVKRSPEDNSIALKYQGIELKLVLRKAMDLIEGRARFKDAFPTLPIRRQWNRDCLEKACDGFITSSPAGAKDKYVTIRKRLDTDLQFFKDVSSLLSPRISSLRGLTKTQAAIHAFNTYNLHAGCSETVRELLKKKNYIYPAAPNGRDYLREKPFEHEAIIRTLRETLFKNRTIVQQFPGRFKPGEEPTYALSPAMVALAATAVFAALKEWESGFRTGIQFMANFYHGVYLDHIKGLNDIKAQKPLAYTSLLRRLFRMASKTHGDVGAGDTIADIDNMAIDEDLLE